MALFSTENRMFACKREAILGEAEIITTADNNIRIRAVELSELEVGYSDSDKILTGDHTRATQTPGLARGAIDTSVQFAVGEWIATGSIGAPVWASKLTYDKLLESNGLLVVGVPPTDEDSSDGYWEIYPEMAGDCQTITASLFDLSSCDGASAEQAIEYKIAGAMSTLVLESQTTGAPFNFEFSSKGKVSSVKKLTGVSIPEYDDSNALFTASAKMLLTDIVLTPVNRDGTAITPVIILTFESDGTTPVSTFAADGTTPVDVYDLGREIIVYDAGQNPISVYDDNMVELVARNGVISIEFDVNTFSLDTGMTQGEIKSQQDAFGIKANPVSTRKPMLAVAPLLEDLDYWNWWTDSTTEVVSRIDIVNYKDVAKTVPQMSITIPRVQLTGTGGTDDEGYRRLESDFSILRNVQGVDKFQKQHDFTLRIYGDTINQTV